MKFHIKPLKNKIIFMNFPLFVSFEQKINIFNKAPIILFSTKDTDPNKPVHKKTNYSIISRVNTICYILRNDQRY